MGLQELVAECLDALESPGWDWRARSRHVDFLSEAVQASLPADVSRLLLSLKGELGRKGGASPMDWPRPDNAVLEEARAYLSSTGVDRYLYHGTVYGRLRSIRDEGLKPGKRRVWTHRADLIERCSRSVFFGETWRAAAGYTNATRSKTRGPRDGAGRLPIVIRIKADGLRVEPDLLAMRERCCMVEGAVSVEAADIFLGPLKGFPNWLPIDQALGKEGALIAARGGKAQGQLEADGTWT